MPYLTYGVNDDGQLIHISQADRGRVALRCPYCAVPLLAKKGQILAAHFAHDGPTCNESESNDFALPVYDKFDLNLPGAVWAALKKFAAGADYNHKEARDLYDYELIDDNHYTGFAELTKLGKIPLGQLSLKLFLEYQKERFLKRHSTLEDYVVWSHTSSLQRLTDLQLYRAQWRRLLQCQLYFIEVKHSSGVMHKIGVTTRQIESRLAEIQRDLLPLLGAVQLTVLDTWQHMGSVEFYFKHRYAAQRLPLGNLTEYFQFEDVKKVLSYDLRKLPRRELTDFERELLAGRPSPAERKLENDAIEARRRAAIKQGLARSKEKIGRPVGSEDAAAFLQKPRSIAIRSALEKGLSIRQAATRARASTATVQKVIAALESLKEN